MDQPNTPEHPAAAGQLQRRVRPAAEARSRWYDAGLSWALADSFASLRDDEWTADDIARAFEAGAVAATAHESEKATLLATMLEDCAQRLEFVCGGGDDKVSTKYLKAAASVLMPNV